MGLFDFLRRGHEKPAAEGPPVDRKFAGLAKTALNKRAQAYDRDEALRGLCAVGTPQAVEVLIKRFTFSIDPSITDQEEKGLCFEGIVRVGKGLAGKRPDGTAPKTDDGQPASLSPEECAELREAVVDITRKFCKGAESLTWPLKVLRELLDDEAYEAEVRHLLSDYDTEYIRNVEPKVNLITALEEVISDQAREAVEVYLDDVNETVRFHAVETTFRQGNPSSLPALVRLMKDEESVRIKNKVAEGMIRLGWTVPPDLRESFAEALEDAYEYRMTRAGGVVKA